MFSLYRTFNTFLIIKLYFYWFFFIRFFVFYTFQKSTHSFVQNNILENWFLNFQFWFIGFYGVNNKPHQLYSSDTTSLGDRPIMGTL